MPYDPFQLKVDVDALTAAPAWSDEKTRRDFIRQVGIDAKGSLDAESHKQLMDSLWQRAEPGMLSKVGKFVGTAVGEAVKSIPAAGGAAVFAATDALGLTDTGSGTRLVQGVKGLADTAGQRIKQFDPNDRQEQRDALLESLREDLDNGAAPQGFEKWLSGEYDTKDIDDPDTRAYVDALVSSVSRAGVAADRMGDIDQDRLGAFMQSDRNPARADSDTPGEAGARQFLADYVATKDPQSWKAFKNRVTETDQQYETRMRTATAQRREAGGALAAAPEGLAKEMITRSFSMQESPIDLASAAFPVLRGAKALQAARAGGAASALKGVGLGMAKEGAQEAGTEYLQDPRATATQIAEAGALGAVGSGVIEGGMAGAGALMRPRDLVTPTTPEEAIVQTVEGSLPAPVVETGFSPEVEANLSAVEKALTPTAVSPVATLTQEPGETGAEFISRLGTQAEELAKSLETAAVQTAAANVDVLPATAAALAAPAPAPVAATPTDPAEIHRKRNAEAKTLTVYDSEDLVDRKATQEKREAAAKAAGMTREAWEEEQSALNQKAKEDFFAALNEGDTLEWTDLNGRKGTGIVEIGLDGRKVVRNTTEESPAEGETYGAQSGLFGQVADALKVTKATPRKQRAGSPAPAPTETLDQARARLRQGLSAEERAEDEGILADVFAEERQRATAREDAQRRLREIDAERARLEQEIAAQETPAPPSEPTPTIEETVPPVPPVPPVQPIPVVEEAPADEADNIGEEADLITRQDIQKAQSKFLQFRGKSVGAGLAHMVKFPDGRVRKVTPFEWGRLNAPDETPEATIDLINENKLKKLTRHQSEQYGRYRFEAKRKGFTPSAAQVGETLDLLKKLNPPEGVTVYLRRLGRLDLLEPSQAAVEEAPAAQTPTVRKPKAKTPTLSPSEQLRAEGKVGFPMPTSAGGGWFSTSDWRKSFKEEVPDLWNKVDLLRAVANNRGTRATEQDLVDALALGQTLLAEEAPDLTNLGWDIAQNPSASPQTKEAALAFREEAFERLSGPPITEGNFPETENVVAPAGEAEVGLGMEKLTSDFDTLFPLPAKQPRTLTAMRDRVIAKMDELESTPALPIYGSLSSEEKDRNFKKNELRDAQLKKLNFILEKIEAEKLMQSKGGQSPFVRPAKRKPATPWSQDRPTVEEAKAYLTEKFGPEADSKYGDAWDSVRVDVNNGIPRNRSIVNTALEEKQLEDDNKAADEKQAKEVAEQEEDKVLPSLPAYTPEPAPPAKPPVQRDVTKPEQMTPEESYEAYTTAKNLAPNLADMPKTRKQIQEGIAIAENSGIKDSELQSMFMGSAKSETGQFAGPYIKAQRIRLIEEAMEDQKPVSAAAVDAYGITLPEGYVRQGDLYVFQPSGTVEAVSETVPPAKKTPESLLSALGGGWKLDGTTVSKDGFGHWTESQRDEVRAIFKKAGILTNTATPSGSGNRKSSFTIPSDDARRIQDEIFAEEVKLREAKKEQAKADEEAKQAEELSRVDPAAKQWMDSLFGRDDFANPANKVHLSDFVTGKTAKFGGMVNPRWLDGVQAADAVLEGGKVDFQKLKENFESSVAKPAPPAKPAAEVETPVAKKDRFPQKYVDQILPSVNAMLDRSDASAVIAEAAGKKLPRKDEVRVVIEWVQQLKESGETPLASDFASLQMEQAYMLEPVLKALGLSTAKPAAEVGTGVAGVPAELSDPGTLTNAQINKEKAALTKKRDSITERMIAADRGSEVSSETMKKTDPLSKEFQEVTRRFQDLSIEAEMRMGSRVYGDLPTDKSWKSYRRKKPEDFGSANTVVTKDAKDKAVKSLRKKIGGQTNIGGIVDPALLKDAVIVGTFYIEGGVRSFAEFSAKMIEEFGAGVQKYLRPAYDEIRKRTDIDTTGMDPEEGGELAPKAPEPEAPAPQPAAPPPPAEPPPPPAPAAATPAPLEGPVSVANEPLNQVAEIIGLPRLETPLDGPYAWPQAWEDARAEFEINPRRGEELVKGMIARPRPPTPLEEVILLREGVTRTNAFNAAVDAQSKATAADQEAANQRVADAINALAEIQQASALMGTLSGRALNFRKMSAWMDFSLANMTTRLQGAKQKDLSEAEMKDAAATYAKITKIEEDIAKTQASAGAEAELTSIFEETFKEAMALTKKNANDLIIQSRSAAKQGKSMKDFLVEKREEARKRIRLRGNNLNMGLNPADLFDHAVIMASYIAEGVVSIADLTAKMIGDFGPNVEKHIPQIKKEADAILAAEQQVFDAPEAAPTKSYAEQLVESKGEALSDRWVYNRVKEWLVEQGEAGLKKDTKVLLDEVFKVITKEVNAFDPSITEQQLRDMFSGYGKVKFPNPEAAAVKLRQMRRLELLLDKLERARAGVAPLRAGLQRDETTPEEREALKLLNQTMKDLDIPRAPSGANIKTPLDAVKSRLKNSIEDLNKQIKERKRAERPRKDVEYDEEAKALETKRDNLQKQLDEIDPPRPPTVEERIQDRLKDLDKQITNLKQRVKEKDFAPAQNQTPITEQIQVKMDERDALSQTLKEMRIEAEGMPVLTQEQVNERAQRNLSRQIDTLEKQISEQDFAPEATLKPEASPALFRLKTKVEALRKQRDQLKEDLGFRRKQKTDAELIDSAVAGLEKTIDKLNKQINEGDLASKARPSKVPEVAKIKNLRAERDSLREEVQRLRKAKEDAAKDPVAEKIKADRKQLQRMIKGYEDRIAKGDFRKRPKIAKVYDDSLMQLEIDLDNIKAEWSRKVFEAHLASRPKLTQIVDTGKQVLNTSRAILTSFDLSAVLRQGGFIGLGNPFRAARNITPMLKAFTSDDVAKASLKRLKQRDNWRKYVEAGLYIAETDQTKMSAQEEAFMSRWIDKIPSGAKGLFLGSVVRGSQRAYLTFLNNLRADTFDSLLNQLQKGPTPTREEMESIAYYINTATGRGDLGKGAWNQAAVGLNTIFFAPRLVASRFQIIGGMPIFKATGRTKALVLQEYAKFLAGASIVYALAGLAQDDDDEPLELDPRSSDFLKIRYGDTRVDPLGGLIQATVFVSRIVTGETKSAKGKITPIRDTMRLPNLFREVPKTDKVPYGGRNAFDLIGNFARTKFSPAFGGAVDIVTGENVIGEAVTPADVVLKMTIPMSFEEAMETLEAHGMPKGPALTVLMMFGAGVMTYNDRK